MGWNRVRVIRPAPILAGLPEDPYFYFVHSYYVEPADPAITAGTTEYGRRFTSVIWRDNLFATSFIRRRARRPARAPGKLRRAGAVTGDPVTRQSGNQAIGNRGRQIVEIIPAIDLRGGRVVRLVQGDPVARNPLRRRTGGRRPGVGATRSVAPALVDLDGAFGGTPANQQALRDICRGSGSRRRWEAACAPWPRCRAPWSWERPSPSWAPPAIRDPGFLRRPVGPSPDRWPWVWMPGEDGWSPPDGSRPRTIRATDLAREVSELPLAAII